MLERRICRSKDVNPSLSRLACGVEDAGHADDAVARGTKTNECRLECLMPV